MPQALLPSLVKHIGHDQLAISCLRKKSLLCQLTWICAGRWSSECRLRLTQAQRLRVSVQMCTAPGFNSDTCSSIYHLIIYCRAELLGNEVI
jgi:hypothetical protein